MQNSRLPIIFHHSDAVRDAIGPDVDKVASLALRAVLKTRRSIEVAHQQIAYRSHNLVFSSRIGAYGDLILHLDIGDPRLADRVILEEDLRRAASRNKAERNNWTGRNASARRGRRR